MLFVFMLQLDNNHLLLASVVRTLEEAGAMDYTIVVNASASDSSTLQFLAPYHRCYYG